MLDLDTRTAILKLHEQGHGKKTIARWLRISKNSVKKVLQDGRAEVPPLSRTECLDAHLERIVELHRSCKGNWVRVREELQGEGIEVAYSTLTAFGRRNRIGVTPKKRAGRYHFEPGQEMQHDTSPHDVTIGGRVRRVQCASLVLCYSRKQYAQVYPRWSRFEARCFLTEALKWMGGAAADCMIDNSSVIIAEGTGKDAVPAPEMKALADRFGFDFIAHAVGDANRSSRVERLFWVIETNFYVGRTFADLADLNRQLLAWCERRFHMVQKRLGASPAELFAVEQPALKPLPPFIPEVYERHRRRVDIEGYVTLHTNRYSVDAELIHHHVEVREGTDQIRIFDGHRLVETHAKQPYGARKRVTLPQHRDQAWRRRAPSQATPEELLLRRQGSELADLIDALQRQYRGQATKAVRRLHRIWTDYPTETVREAISVALGHGLLDLGRIETMVLQRVAGDFFRLPTTSETDDG
ncbi:MAG TPA: IS21 family transposase [Polyangiaceae bacterium]|nr:IS21 family transposase [Polyangiaceae bacterium]